MRFSLVWWIQAHFGINGQLMECWIVKCDQDQACCEWRLVLFIRNLSVGLGFICAYTSHQIKSHHSLEIQVLQVKAKGRQNGRSVMCECAPAENSMQWFFFFSFVILHVQKKLLITLFLIYCFPTRAAHRRSKDFFICILSNHSSKITSKSTVAYFFLHICYAKWGKSTIWKKRVLFML